jgi:hypothetical protein
MGLTQSFKKIYKTLLPIPVLKAKDEFTLKLRYASLHKAIYEYLKTDSSSPAHTSIADYLNEHFLPVFPYPFADKYKLNDVNVLFNTKKKLHYVIWQDKPLYFKRDFTVYDIKRAVVALQTEQDNSSAHRYLTNDFSISNDSVIVDIGAAEGNFSLQAIEKAKKVFIVEADSSWHYALEATFEPWKEKVEIINKFASDKESANEIDIDSIFKKEGRIDFIKIDAEGSEQKVLDGAMQLIKTTNEKLQIALCTYHKQNDAEIFSSLLKELNFNVTFSDGYMIFFYDKNQAPPYLRKALIRATKNGKL